MPSIDIDDSTYEKLMITAQLMEKPIGVVVKQLLDRIATTPVPVAPVPSSPVPSAGRRTVPVPSGSALDAWIPVAKVFKGHRFDGAFNPSTMELKVTTAPWSGRVFSSPTAAAIAVVEHIASDRETSNTNGRKFWKVVATGRDLRSIVGER